MNEFWLKFRNSLLTFLEVLLEGISNLLLKVDRELIFFNYLEGFPLGLSDLLSNLQKFPTDPKSLHLGLVLCGPYLDLLFSNPL